MKTTKTHILFICDPASIHNHKWIFLFSNAPEYKIFVSGETIKKDEQEIRTLFEKNSVTLLPPLPTFSIKNFLKTYGTVRWLKKILTENKIDIVHVLFITPYAFWTAFVSTPIVLTTYGSDILLVIPGLLKSKGFRGAHDRVLFSILKHAFAKAAAVSGTSIRQIEFIKKFFLTRNEPQLIRTGIDVKSVSEIDAEKHLPNELKNEFFIFSPRYLLPVYNIELQSAAIKLLPKEILQKYRFVFINGKTIDEFYQQKILDALSKIEGLRFHIFEFLTQKQIWSCFKKAKLTLITPHSDGTPNSALEAMAARCPLILGDFNYDEDIFSGTAMRLSKNSPEILAAEIQNALKNYSQQMIDEAFQRVSKLGNLPLELQKLEKIYNEILKK